MNLTGLELVRYLHAFINFYSCVLELCENFLKVDLVEIYGNFARVRFARNDKTIGFVFGLIESIKMKYEISEYSVSQTTLE